MQIFTRKPYRCFINKSSKARISILMLFLFMGTITVMAQNPPPACGVITSNCSGILTACVNQEVNYTANVVFYGGATYNWDFPVNTSGATIISGQGTPMPVVNVGSNAGQYTLRLTMVNDGGTTTCSASLSVIQINSTATFTPVTATSPTSVLTVAASGSLAPYTYTLEPGGISNGTGVFTGLLPGTYTVTVANGPTSCISTNTVIIPGAGSGLNFSATETHNNISCFGGNNGSIDLTVSGGIAPYTFMWFSSNGGVVPSGQFGNEDLTGLVPGTYSVTVTDATGASFNTSVIISQPLAALTSAENHINVSCFGSPTGSIDLTVNGGTSPYTYQWLGMNGGFVPAAQMNNQDINSLVAGSYQVTVTDAGGCTTTRTINITEPASGIESGLLQSNVTCLGGANGAIDLTITGGNPPYTYMWSASNGGAIPAGQAGSQDLTGLTAGTYSVIISDATNCTKTRTIEITQPLTGITIEETHINGNCLGTTTGSIDISINGGTAPYTYTWTAANGGIIPAGQINNEDLNGLVAGIYTVVVTDAGGCSRSHSITVTQSGFDADATHVNVSCFGGSTGSVNLTVTGGNPPYSYLWTASAGGSIPAGQATVEDLSNLMAGTYSVSITDASGCNAMVTVAITQPLQLTATTVSSNVMCLGATGTIDLTVSGGSLPYTYNWVAQMGNGSVPASQVHNQDLTGLTGGTYTVVVTDAHGCTISKTVVISVIPSSVATSAIQVNNSCFGGATGSIDLSVSGGVAPYTYSWTGFAGGIIPAGQANNQDLNSLVAGMYIVTCTDINGCTSSRTVTITAPLTGMSITETHNNAGCSNSSGSIDITVSGGTTPYTYAWTASAGGVLPAGQAANQDLTGLVAGNYTVIVTDGGGCTMTHIIQITGSSLVLAQTNTNVSCFGGSNGSIDITINGGASPYSYTWTATGGGSIPSGQSAGQDLTGLGAGIYHIVVTDGNGCTADRTVTISQPAAILATSIDINEGCQPATGSIDLTVTGGISPYSYSWAIIGAGLVPPAQIHNQDLSGLIPGIYEATITDAHGCTNVFRTNIQHVCGGPTPCDNFTTTATQVNVGCGATASGSIDLSVSGGTAPYNYTWTASAGGVIPAGQSANQDLTGLMAGEYHVVVSDANGCSTSHTITITQSPALNATYSITNVSCNGENNGAIDITVTGGSDLIYTWLATGGGNVPPGQLHNQDLSQISAGNYTVIILGSACGVVTHTVAVTEPDALAITATHENSMCMSPSGSINISVSGGTAPYSYLWTATSGGNVPAGQAGLQDLTGIIAGNYSVIVTDAHGCTKLKSISISQSVSNIQITAAATNVLCNEGATGSVHIMVAGGNAPYSYTWVSSAGGIIPVGQLHNQNLTDLVAGNYTVTVTDVNGCTKSKNVTITQPNPIEASVTQNNVSTCGGSNGSVNLSVPGGTPPYTYLWTAAAGGVIPAGQANHQDLTGLNAGTYTVTITNANGCTVTLIVIITQNCNGNSGDYGCSYKYWRSHIADWDQTTDFVVSHMPASLRFTSSTNFFLYFNIPQGSAGLPSNLTMEDALNLHGGGCKDFSKYAVSALLTSASGQPITYPAGTNNFSSLYNVIRTALMNSNCNNPLKNELKHIKHDCHDPGHDDEDDDDGNNGNNGNNGGNHGNHGNQEGNIGGNNDHNGGDHEERVNVIVTAYPNPYTDQVTFRINSDFSGEAVFELYGLLGEKVSELYKGPISKKSAKTLIYKSQPGNRRTLIYKLKIGNEIKTGKVLYVN